MLSKITILLIIILALVLRFYKLDTNPPGLYWDEAVFGYDAYSVLKTGKDQHGEFLPLFFESFGDWKLPIYHYLLVPSIAVFGLNEFAVRFPSALLGTLTVIVFYFLIKKLLEDNPTQGSAQAIPALSTLMLAISPWHIQFSRGGFESTAGLFALTLGAYLTLLAIERKNILHFTTSGIFFVASMYSYHAYRLFVPLFLIALVFIYRREIVKLTPKILIAAIVPILILIPLARFSLTSEGQSRAISQSTFKKEELEQARLDYDQKSKKPLRFLSKYLYNPPLYYSYIALNNYFDHFSPVFLFFKGDQIGRHSQVDMGQIHMFEGVLILLSIFAFKKINSNTKKIMIFWLILSPLPAIIVGPTPHAYRTLQMSIPLAFLSGLGTYFLFSVIKFSRLLSLLLAIIAYSVLTHIHLLFTHYPKKFAADWQDGYKQMVQEVQKFQDNFDKIYITNINQVPYIYLLFYQNYNPQTFISQNGTSDSFDKYIFISDDFDLYNEGRILYVAPSWKKIDGIWLAAADNSSGKHIYSLWEINDED